jgi:hypothetical protein
MDPHIIDAAELRRRDGETVPEFGVRLRSRRVPAADVDRLLQEAWARHYGARTARDGEPEDDSPTGRELLKQRIFERSRGIEPKEDREKSDENDDSAVGRHAMMERQANAWRGGAK